MADKDVNLVIRAKEQATKAIDSVAAALRELSDVQKDVGQSASKADGLLGALKSELAALDKEARGLAAFNTVATQLDKAASAVGRMDAAVKASHGEYDKLSAALGRAATNTRLHAAFAADAKAAYDKQKAAVASLTAEQRKDEVATAAARVERDRLKAASQEAAAALRTVAAAETALQGQLAKTSQTAEQQNAALSEANSELAQIAALAQKASAALGGVEATQEAVAAASAKAAADMERVNRAMQQQVPTGGSGATVASTKASLLAWREAEAEVKRLAQAMKSTEAPSREMRVEMIAAQAAARSAKTAYSEQRLELAKLSAGRRVETVVTRESSAAQVQNTAVVHASTQAKKQAATETFRLRDAFKGIYGESRQAMNMFQRLRSEVLSLTSAYVGFYAILNGAGTVINTMRAVEQAQNRLSVAFGGNQAAVGAEMRWLEAEAARLKMSFVDLAAEYGKFAFSAKTAGFATEEMRTVFLGVAEGARVMGLSMDQVQGILKALDQIMSKGKVQAEELRGQLGDRLSGSFQLFAQAIGVTTQELDKMMEKGEVFATRSNMVAFGQKLRDTFGPQLAGALETTTSEISDFQANLQTAARQVGEGGFWDGLGSALRDLNGWFKSDEGEKFFTNIGVALGKLMGVIPAVVENFDKLILLFQAFVGIKTAQVVMSLMGGLRGLSVETAAARANVLGLAVSLQMLSVTASGPARAGLTGLASVVTGLRGVLIAGAAAARAFWIALGGLPGLLITGLTMIVSLLAGKWLTGVDRATEALSRHDEMINKVKEGFTEAAGEVKAWAKAIEDVTFTELKASGDEAAETMKRLKDQALDQYFNELTYGLDMFSRTERDILKPSIEKFREGKISAEAFRQEIDEIAKANPNLDQKLVKALVDTAQEAVKAERRLREVAAAIRAKGGAATEADRKLLDLADALDSVNKSADTSAIDKYTAALKALGDGVPEIKMQTDLDAKRKEIEDIYKKGVEGLVQTGGDTASLVADMRVLLETRDRRLAALIVDGQATGSYRDFVYGIESRGGDNNATNPRNPRVLGAAQFDESTWLNLFKRVSPNDQRNRAEILELRRDPAWTNRLFDILTEDNTRALRQGGFAETDVNKYLAHLLGAPRALSVLRSGRDTPNKTLGEILPREVISDNAPLLKADMSPATLQSTLQAKRNGTSAPEVSAHQQVVDLLAEARKKQDDFNNSIVAGVSQREFEIAQLGRSEREQLVQIELRKHQAEAEKENLELTDEQEASIRRSTEALFDASSAEDARKVLLEANTALLRAQGVEETRAEYIAARMGKVDAEGAYGKELARTLGLTWDVIAAEKARNAERDRLDTDATNLQAQQQLLMEQIEFTESQGDTGAAEALRLKLDEVNLAYRNALLAKRAFWSQQVESGGAGAEQAAGEVARIDSAILQLDALGKKSVTTGKQINQSIASGIGGAFDQFAQSVAEGKNAWESFGDAFRQFASDFLRQIAQMIIQAVILKMIGGGDGGGGGLGGFISKAINGGVRHNGGMVGSGGGYRSVWAGHFNNATRYHSGGIVGLKPNEEPIIAERGEEVLDADDPRHRDNFGGAGVGSIKVVNMFDPGDMLDQGLATESGERAFLNFVSRNSGAFKASMG